MTRNPQIVGRGAESSPMVPNPMSSVRGAEMINPLSAARGAEMINPLSDVRRTELINPNSGVRGQEMSPHIRQPLNNQ
jgi:hypothetical protein